jgi:chromosome segregation ATPase
MSRANRALSVLVVASLGLWGCAQGPANGPASVERIRALETKHAKLEDDFRATVTARDQLKKKLAAAEERQGQLAQQVGQLQEAAKERDQARQELTARTGERDNLQAQFDQFRKGIRNLLGQVETTPTAPSAAAPGSVTAPSL